jgi:hypothetical protein
MQPGRFTELFFLDEATALAAGHRPCALCRRDDYNAFVGLWKRRHPEHQGADTLDAFLHWQRLDQSTRRRMIHHAPAASLPEGTFVLAYGHPHVVIGDALRPWTPAGYGPPQPRARDGDVELITPPSTVAVLRDGWISTAVPFIHPSAYV